MQTIATSLLLASAVTIAATAGCYKTEIGSPLANPSAQTHENRQWFTAAGLVNLSGAAGAECGEYGVAYASSRVSGWDILIDVAVGIGAGLVGTVACETIDDKEEFASCVSAAAALGPVVISARTVSYRCNFVPVPATGKLPLLPNMASVTEDEGDR